MGLLYLLQPPEPQYFDSPTGSITLSGSCTESWARTSSPSGTITLSGSLPTRTYNGLVLAESPRSYYRLNETAGTAAVDEQGIVNGAHINTPNKGVTGLLTGDSNKAVQYVAASSHYTTVNGPDLTTDGTISYRFNWTAGTAVMRDNTSLAGWIILFDVGSGNAGVRVAGTSIVLSGVNLASVRDGTTHSFMMTKAGAEVRIYIDGVQRGTSSAIGNSTTSMPWVLGRNGALSGFADLTFDEYAIYLEGKTAGYAALLHQQATNPLPGEGQAHTSSPSGTITLSGSVVEVWGHSDAPTGTITLSGTCTESHARTVSRTGTLTLSGTASESLAFSDTGTGTLALSGSSTEALSFSDSTNGTAALAGSSTEAHAHSQTASGDITWLGTADEEHEHTSADTATFTLDGTSDHTADYDDDLTGAILLDGSVVEAYEIAGNFFDNPVGTIVLSGSSTEAGSRTGQVSGEVTLTGSRLETMVYVDTATGTITITGSGSVLISDSTVGTAANRFRTGEIARPAAGRSL